jgi:hypothetical protein
MKIEKGSIKGVRTVMDRTTGGQAEGQRPRRMSAETQLEFIEKVATRIDTRKFFT